MNLFSQVHLLSPTGTAMALVLAFAVDWMSLGPNSIRDRVAFLIAVGAIRDGFNGSTIDLKLTELCGGAIDQGKVWAGDAYIADADTAMVLGAAMFSVLIFALGCMAPSKFHTRLGGFARYSFKCGSRINWKLWLCAFLLGIGYDLTPGFAGTVMDLFVYLCCLFAVLVTGFMFSNS